MADVKVDPGDIEDFGKLAAKRAEDWANKHAAPYKLVTGGADSYHYPNLGKFQEAEEFLRAYGGEGGKLQDAAKAFNALHSLLESVADASKKIAKQYDSVEALNGADVDQINKILGEEFKGSGPDGAGQVPEGPATNTQPPTSQS